MSFQMISCNIVSILQTGNKDGDMATIGRIEEFRDDKEDWNQYAERLEHFLQQTGLPVTKEASRVSYSNRGEGLQAAEKPDSSH